MQLLKERDGVLRGASLAVIEGVWAEQGPDTLWKLLGPLESREKGMVEDRLRRSTKATKFGDAAAAEVAGPAYTPEAPRPGAFDPYAGVSQGNGAGQASLQPTDNGGNGELSYARPALTPPNALDITPVAERTRPATYGEENAASTPDAYIPRAVAPSAIATPVPQPMPSTPAARVIPQTGPEDAAFERRWEEHLAAMAGPSLPDAINATKMLCADVMLVADPKAPPASQRVRAVMAASAERLFGTVLAQLDCIFDQAEQEAALGVPASSRGCKFALNVLLQGLGVPEVALGLPQATLRETMSVLLCRLVDERGLTVFDEGPTLVRAVNVLIAKLLENADRNCAFAALLQLLREPPAGVTGDLLAKYNVVVVKCLIKLTKALGGGVAGVDLSRLLFNIHDFFMYLGVDEIRKRSRSDDKPLRMVKTILFEVCKVTGHRVYDYAAGIPGRHSDHPPIIFTYIQLNLNQLQQEGKLGAAIDPGPEVPSPAPVVAPGQERPARAVPWAEEVPPAAPAEIQAQAAKAEVKLRLKEVMMRLVSKDAAQQEAAMVDLARLKKWVGAWVLMAHAVRGWKDLSLILKC